MPDGSYIRTYLTSGSFITYHPKPFCFDPSLCDKKADAMLRMAASPASKQRRDGVHSLEPPPDAPASSNYITTDQFPPARRADGGGREPLSDSCTAAKTTRLFDHLVGALLQVRRNFEAERFRSLRSMTSSNLVGACTGRSAGLSPLRIRSTQPSVELCRHYPVHRRLAPLPLRLVA
jgi:hypothetical protein